MEKILAIEKSILKKIKEAFCFPLVLFINCAGFVVSLFDKDAIPLFIKKLCMSIKDKQYYYAVYIRPKCHERDVFVEGLNYKHKIAIILQGPICTENNMTIDTVNFYHKMYPYSKIIISTWKGEDSNIINELESLGAVVLSNNLPSKSGVLNVNYQIISSLAGLLKAKELGYAVAVKTRTDQRICKHYAFDSILAAIEMYKPIFGSVQRGRIALLSTHYGNMFTPYFMSDFMYMGYIDDLLALFSAPIDYREDIGNLIIRKKGGTRREYSRTMYPPEIYLLKHYLCDVLCYECDDTVEAYWRAIKNYFICYSAKDVDLFWLKYGRYYELNSYYGSFFRNPKLENSMASCAFDFMNWFALYSGMIEYRKDYEKYADSEMLP